MGPELYSVVAVLVYVEMVTSMFIGFRASSLNFIWILKSHLGMYDEPPTNKQGIQTNAELFVIQNTSWV